MLKLPKNFTFRISKKHYFAALALTILLAGLLTFNIVNQKRQITTKKQFIGIISSNLISADQSLDEVIKSLDIVNANYQRITAPDATFQKTQYDIVISDNQKSLTQIESIQGNLNAEKELISGTKTPTEYESLKVDLVSYYSQIDKLLMGLVSDFKFENNILKVISINSTQGKILKSDVWQKQDKVEIINYYKDLKDQAILTLGGLSKIKVDAKYQNYYNLQNSYLGLISATADEVINILQASEIPPISSDDPTQIEKAYQSAFNAQNNINNVTKQIIDERERLLPLKVSRPDFDYLANIQKSLESKVKILNQDIYKQSQRKLLIF